DFFASAASKALTAEGFATSSRERPSASAAMWLSGSGARQPGMTPRFRVTTLFFICSPPRKEEAAPDGWQGGLGSRGERAVVRRSHNTYEEPLAGVWSANSAELRRFADGNQFAFTLS